MQRKLNRKLNDVVDSQEEEENIRQSRGLHSTDSFADTNLPSVHPPTRSRNLESPYTTLPYEEQRERSPRNKIAARFSSHPDYVGIERRRDIEESEFYESANVSFEPKLLSVDDDDDDGDGDDDDINVEETRINSPSRSGSGQRIKIKGKKSGVKSGSNSREKSGGRSKSLSGKTNSKGKLESGGRMENALSSVFVDAKRLGNSGSSLNGNSGSRVRNGSSARMLPPPSPSRPEVVPLPIEIPESVTDPEAFRRYLSVRRGATGPATSTTNPFTSPILVGIGYVVISRFEFSDRNLERANSYLIFGLFFVAIANVIIAAFALDGNVCQVSIKKIDKEQFDTIEQPPPQPII